MERDERRLLIEIAAAKTEMERQRLISELSKIPLGNRSFHQRWLAVQGPQLYYSWTDSRFEPQLSHVSRDAQLLGAMHYGKSDIENGGLLQFFDNSTGAFAPEMIEWCDRAGFPETAAVLREAIAKFGSEFPRSQEARQKRLEQFREEPGWDYLETLTDRFYTSIPFDDKRFETTADHWLREVCGVRTLQDKGKISPP